MILGRKYTPPNTMSLSCKFIISLILGLEVVVAPSKIVEIEVLAILKY
jgi:hypothetical protein